MTEFPFFPGTYRARCVRVVDGDTADFEVDAGFHLRYVGRFRLLGINAREMNAKDPDERQRAADATFYLKSALTTFPTAGWYVKLTDVRKDPDAFGRYLCRPVVVGMDGEELDVCQDMLARGLAKPFEG